MGARAVRNSAQVGIRPRRSPKWAAVPGGMLRVPQTDADKLNTEMLERLRARMDNSPEVELRVAAGEQMKITKLRLDKLEVPA